MYKKNRELRRTDILAKRTCLIACFFIILCLLVIVSNLLLRTLFEQESSSSSSSSSGQIRLESPAVDRRTVLTASRSIATTNTDPTTTTTTTTTPTTPTSNAIRTTTTSTTTTTKTDARTTVVKMQGFCFSPRSPSKPRASQFALPCIPTDVNYSNYSRMSSASGSSSSLSLLEGLLTVQQRQVGLYAAFNTSTIPPAPLDKKHRHSYYAKLYSNETSLTNKKIKLRVVVHASGHLRSFRKCAASLKENVLEMNEAPFYLVTYPNIGDRRLGTEGTEDGDPPLSSTDMQELIYHYRPYLAGLFLLDYPAMDEYLSSVVPPFLFQNYPWGWWMRQFFTTELATDMSTASMEGNNNTVNNTFLKLKLEQTLYTKPGYNSVDHAPFDIAIRVRPDLCIIGPLWVESILPVEEQRRALLKWSAAEIKNQTSKEDAVLNQSFAVYFKCKKTSYEPLLVPPRHIVRASYHSKYPDYTSDFSAIMRMDDDNVNNNKSVPGSFFRFFHEATTVLSEKELRA
ncbi:uncharacterized protein TM35_000391030, partial [Trypanosoma theileri]